MADRTVQYVFDQMPNWKKETLYWIVGTIVNDRVKSKIRKLSPDERLVTRHILKTTIDEMFGEIDGNEGT